MSVQTPTPTGFNLYDLLTRITPGAFLLIMTMAARIDTSVLLSYANSSAFSVFILFAGFLAGELIDSLRMSYFAAPKTFRYLLYEERGQDPQYLTQLDRLRSRVIPYYPSIYLEAQESFWNDFKHQFQVDDDLKDGNDIYLRLHTYLDPQLTPIAHRYQTTTIFVQNLWLASVFSIVSILLSYVASSYEVTQGMRPLMLFLVVMILMLLSGLNGPERVYIRLLLTAFSVDQPKEED